MCPGGTGPRCESSQQQGFSPVSEKFRNFFGLDSGLSVKLAAGWRSSPTTPGDVTGCRWPRRRCLELRRLATGGVHKIFANILSHSRAGADLWVGKGCNLDAAALLPSPVENTAQRRDLHPFLDPHPRPHRVEDLVFRDDWLRRSTKRVSTASPQAPSVTGSATPGPFMRNRQPPARSRRKPSKTKYPPNRAWSRAGNFVLCPTGRFFSHLLASCVSRFTLAAPTLC